MKGQPPGYVAGVCLTSPPFVSSFWNPFSSPVLQANCSINGAVGARFLSPVTKFFLSSTDKGDEKRTPSSPPTTVASSMRNRQRKFGFVSIVKQMMAVLMTGRLDVGDSGPSASMISDRNDKESDALIPFLANTVFRDSSIFAVCAHGSRPPYFLRSLLLSSQRSFSWGLSPTITPVTTNVASRDSAPMVCSGPGADLFALIWRHRALINLAVTVSVAMKEVCPWSSASRIS